MSEWQLLRTSVEYLDASGDTMSGATMWMNLVLAALLAAGAAATAHEWAPIAINGDGDTLYLVDRTSIKAGPATSSAVLSAVSQATALRLHVDFDCAGARFRYLDAGNPDGGLSGVTKWNPLQQGTPMHQTSRYVCAGGKIDLGFGDLVLKAETPEAFARAFLKSRSEKN